MIGHAKQPVSTSFLVCETQRELANGTAVGLIAQQSVADAAKKLEREKRSRLPANNDEVIPLSPPSNDRNKRKRETMQELLMGGVRQSHDVEHEEYNTEIESAFAFLGDDNDDDEDEDTFDGDFDGGYGDEDREVRQKTH